MRMKSLVWPWFLLTIILRWVWTGEQILLRNLSQHVICAAWESYEAPSWLCWFDSVNWKCAIITRSTRLCPESCYGQYIWRNSRQVITCWGLSSFFEIPIPPTPFIHFLYDKLGELRFGSLGFGAKILHNYHLFIVCVWVIVLRGDFHSHFGDCLRGSESLLTEIIRSTWEEF